MTRSNTPQRNRPAKSAPARPRRRPRRRLLQRLVVAVAISLAVGAAAAAAQQLPPEAEDPGTAADGVADTEYTPKAKGEGEQAKKWVRVAGAKYGNPEDALGPTDKTVDLHGVSFFDNREGFAGGAACAPGVEDLNDCTTRFPALYRYTADEQAGREALWERVEDLPGQDRPGFVAAIAWIGPDTALAVGGTGRYPRRELEAREGETDEQYGDRDETEGAGLARAWLYEGGRWCEIELDCGEGHGTLPMTNDPPPAPQNRMRALTALDCTPHNRADAGFCVAGGMQQLWHWRGGRFVKSFTLNSKDTQPNHNGDGTFDDPQGFRFRVRDVRFDPRPSSDVVAVTSGCCAADQGVAGGARLLSYKPQPREHWHSRLLVNDPQWTAAVSGAERTRRRKGHPPQSLADSYYGLAFTGHPDDPRLSVVTAAGRPPLGAREPTSQIVSNVTPPDPDGTPPGGISGPVSFVRDLILDQSVRIPSHVQKNNPGRSDATGGVLGEVIHPNVSTLRLHAGDGDATSPVHLEADALGSNPGGSPDGVVDWAVGVLRSSDQGVAYTTARGDYLPDPLACPISDEIANDLSRCTRPNDDLPGEQAKLRSSRLVALPTYGLNAFRFVPDSGVAWAVGDKGAIVRLGGEGTVGSLVEEPDPPRGLRSGEVARPTTTEPYDRFRPLGSGATPGEVPPLFGRGVETLREPRLVSTGIPDPTRPQNERVGEVVMSRAGSEGWAFTPTNRFVSGGLSLYRWNGSRWSECEVEGGYAGLIPPDPACEELAPLKDQKILSAARVPLENDDDPANDDELEVVAVGTGAAVIRYRGGRWTRDEEAAKELSAMHFAEKLEDVAFTSPDDGWITTYDRLVVHFDGEDWINCFDKPGECGDPGGRLPAGDFSSAKLTTVGERVYLYGIRNVGGIGTGANAFPAIIYKDPDDEWTAEDGGYDPGVDRPTPDNQGKVKAMSAVELGKGRYAGWAFGDFGGVQTPVGDQVEDTDALRAVDQGRPMLRLDPGTQRWSTWKADDAASDYQAITTGVGETERLASFRAPDGAERAVLAPDPDALKQFPLLSFDSRQGGGGRWSVLPTPFGVREKSLEPTRGKVTALASEGDRTVWLAVKQRGLFANNQRGETTEDGTQFYRLSDRAPRDVFDDVAHPIREPITGTAAASDGTLWVATESRNLYRYDRLTGWERIQIPGWDPGRIVTASSPASAIAVNAGGEGVVVGPGGRIADLGPAGVRLDRAAGVSCKVAPRPCGTGRDLRSAAVAPDGSALVGGSYRALLWRPPGGEFRSIAPPDTSLTATFTAISMPRPDRAYVATKSGQIFAGRLAGESWSWRLDNEDAGRRLLSRDRGGERALAVRALELDAQGEGLAVGDEGLILERTGNGAQPWRRLNTGRLDDFRSVSLAPNGSRGALIGGNAGLILTRVGGRFEVARPADPFTAASNSRATAGSARIYGVELLPGLRDGQVETWAASQLPSAQEAGGPPTRDPRPGAILHYTSDPAEPLLSPQGRSHAKPDAPAPRPGELSFAALGRSDCHLERQTCPEPQGTELTNELVMRRASDAIAGHAARGRADFALWTGDISHAAGRDRELANTPLDVNVVHRRWTELIPPRFAEAGVPLFGALGGRDLSQTHACDPLSASTCLGTHGRDVGGAGSSAAWRSAMAGMPRPWGAGPAARWGALSFEPVRRSRLGVRQEGASTHYALDVKRDGEPLARLVVVDTSMRTLAMEANQSRVESRGTQLRWLEHMLASRPEGTGAVVLSNTPTYSYGPGAGTNTQIDGTPFEALMLKHRVSVVVSGRIGWNARYWTTAAGVHVPCPGGRYLADGERPAPGTRDCTGASGAVPGAGRGLSDALADHGVEVPDPEQAATGALVGQGLAGAVPFVIASGAGGRLADAGGKASDGYWHGYTVVRVPENGDAAGVVVEQRPVFDWIGIDAVEHTLRPGQHMTLRGYGREALGMDTPARYDAIDSPAITHRYDLLLADEERPWLPKRDADGGYVPVPPDVATIDRQSGLVRVGRGNHPRVYAIGLLSVGDRSTTWPLVFEPRRSFRPKPAQLLAPLPAPRVLSAATAPLQSPPPPPAVGTQTPSVDIPPPPPVPGIPAAGSPDVQPPVPPAPPPPPVSPQATPLDIVASPVGLNVAPQATVIPPPAPPIQPAPPGGARKEARQRQAATAKSEEAGDGEEGAGTEDDAQARTNLVTGEQLSTRLEPGRDRLAFTAVRGHEQPSAWVRGAAYGGGMARLAFVLAFGWWSGRPGPRRRGPPVPSPAWERARASRTARERLARDRGGWS